MVAYGFAVYYAWVGYGPGNAHVTRVGWIIALLVGVVRPLINGFRYGEWMFALALYSGFIGFFLFWLIEAIIHNEYLYKG